MTSIVLQSAARALHPILLMFSVFLLMRGHNEPGGGFSGGLVAATAFVLQTISSSVAESRRALRVHPRALIAIGLLFATTAGIIPLFSGDPFLTGLWFDAPLLDHIKVGTPLLFDTGVYLVVIGMTVLIVWTLYESAES
jgi:multicomponent Na+:H+ antiporter subunit B